MKVPGFENPKAPSADPRRLAPMVVEVDLLTTRIKTVETQAHDSPEHIKQMLAGLLGDGAARLTGQVIAVDGGFTTVRPLVR